MTHATSVGEGKEITDEAAAAASDVAGDILSANVHQELPGAAGSPDDLLKLKGVGPKLAGILNERGITRFDQIAKLSPGQIESLDASLGAFRGRFERDRIQEQADYLSRGDVEGYEVRFGKL
jgi:predicted flap endonuclease-1-like 5' DNA nuclease